ncbi:MAG: hypothetical protein AB7G28_17990 [Pirellulales bacterium]
MVRRLALGFALWMLALSGCGSSTSSEPAATNTASTAPAAPAATNGPHTVNLNDPAAVAANQFLEAVVKGDTATASSLLTPLAIERINESGKPFQLPGLSNYTFKVAGVLKPVPDKAFVQCMGTDRSSGAQPVEEEFCWLMCLVNDQWRIAGISYSVGPQKQLMIYSFENPEKGAIPVQKLMPQQQPAAGQTAASPLITPAAQPPAQSQPDRYSTETPRTAREALPAGTYR